MIQQLQLFISEGLMKIAFKLAPGGELGHDLRTYISAYFLQKGCDNF